MPLEFDPDLVVELGLAGLALPDEWRRRLDEVWDFDEFMSDPDNEIPW